MMAGFSAAGRRVKTTNDIVDERRNDRFPTWPGRHTHGFSHRSYVTLSRRRRTCSAPPSKHRFGAYREPTAG